MSTKNTEIQQLLDTHVNKIAGVRGAVVLSDEGNHMYWSAVDEGTAERRAPLASALGNLANRYAAEESGGAVRRVLIEMGDGFVSVSRVGSLAYLALSISPTADLSTVGYEAGLLTKRLAHVLDASLRVPEDGGTA
ncbi:hypothetical protein G3260_001025 [Streptomyces albus]|uniref:roadblock/LC7 domain-containing protein n=1 Tax=Streptomyces TaxID=1883 RepID=UPI0004CC0481|nr:MULTISPECIES: roadblock/LC7 domain-containing protein [Streptomyces]QID35114.1 hypothetical protein G3260_001025 [Streptomyces albus]